VPLYNELNDRVMTGWSPFTTRFTGTLTAFDRRLWKKKLEHSNRSLRHKRLMFLRSFHFCVATVRQKSTFTTAIIQLMQRVVKTRPDPSVLVNFLTQPDPTCGSDHLPHNSAVVDCWEQGPMRRGTRGKRRSHC